MPLGENSNSGAIENTQILLYIQKILLVNTYAAQMNELENSLGLLLKAEPWIN